MLDWPKPNDDTIAMINPNNPTSNRKTIPVNANHVRPDKSP